MTVLADGEPVDCQVEKKADGTVYTFATAAGKEYRLQPV